MNKLIVIFKDWSAYAAIITLLCFIIYFTVQQTYRQNANDPQYQLAEDAANAINRGTDPGFLINKGNIVEISRSLAVYLVIYDSALNVIATNATLDGKAPMLPRGVLNY